MLTNHEMLKTFSNSYKEKIDNAKNKFIIEKFVLDEKFEKSKRNRLFRNYAITIFIISIFSMILFLPVTIMAGITSSYFLSIAPMIILSISWALPTWYYLKQPAKSINLTIGMIPIRILFFAIYIHMISSILVISTLSFILFMLWHWIIFTIPEIIMIMKLNPPTIM